MGEISKQEEQKFAILDLVRLNPGISRQNLSQRLDLSSATVSNFVEELIKRNLIQEAGSKNFIQHPESISLDNFVKVAKEREYLPS